ncbi:GNAT family N-acetyltransferase [Nonomuraea sp. KC401]|uniref:GNAT family N-acetyltransferase n=1 Tax=unclassified Nonomuraea TaxID=2593643 RepID=UPI0010FD31EC|nr:MULTISPECIES: GNAT family N-acetyltransferase [unclassified Nonomuraea]NBE92876.1 GNAT family N-acetyltransferase [Nonomuraea sp. K271]TLF83385.1 GNAT family N-acetyltransferase [Nonomuraea sp. KC401]
MRIQPIDLDDQPDDLVAGLYDAYVAAAAADDRGPLPRLARFHRDLCTPDLGRRAEAWVAVEDGKVVGGYGLSLPLVDNAHLGVISALAVHPERQRRGLGTELFAHVLGRLRHHGRRLLLAETPVTGDGARFARARGMEVALAEARRVLDLRRADWAALERMIPEVDGYHVERFEGPAGAELAPDLATLMDGMNDAPRDSGVEDGVFSPERVRHREEGIVPGGQTCYTSIARRDSDGAPAGYTRIYVNADRSDGWAGQADTTVLGAHRGHRLGLLLKVGNLLWLREREPHVERILTWNATGNRHMLAINEAMGFELFDEWNQWRMEVQARVEPGAHEG